MNWRWWRRASDDGLELDLQEAAEAEEDVLACLCPRNLVGHYTDCPQAGSPR